MYIDVLDKRYSVRPNADPKDVLFALSDAVESTFKRRDWDKLGSRVEGRWFIEDDERLLRSLYWGDDDYGSAVTRVIASLIKHDPKNTQIIERLVGLESYLKRNDPELYDRLYELDMVIDDSDSIPTALNNVEIKKQITRIKSSMENDDPALTIGTSKDLLETVLKAILDKLGQSYTNKDDIPTLLKSVQNHLNIDPNGQTTKLQETLRRTLNNFGQIVVGIAEIRNMAGTGHGNTTRPDVDKNHALLVLNSVYIVSTYLIRLFHDQKQ